MHITLTVLSIELPDKKTYGPGELDKLQRTIMFELPIHIRQVDSIRVIIV